MNALESPKPLFGLKHDFYESLDHALQEAINLLNAVDHVIQLAGVTGIKPDAAKMPQERSDALRKALMSNE